MMQGIDFYTYLCGIASKEVRKFKSRLKIAMPLYRGIVYSLVSGEMLCYMFAPPQSLQSRIFDF